MRMLKGAIIGFGEVARNGHWPGYAASGEAEIVAVVDRSAERRKLAQESLPGVATFSSIEDLAAGAVVIVRFASHSKRRLPILRDKLRDFEWAVLDLNQ